MTINGRLVALERWAVPHRRRFGTGLHDALVAAMARADAAGDHAPMDPEEAQRQGHELRERLRGSRWGIRR
jgi:hypothetical protein